MKVTLAACVALSLAAGGAAAQTPPAPVDPAPAAGLGTNKPPGPAKSARFRLKVGNIFLGLTCPDDEPMKACADFAMQLLDKAEAMQAH